MSGATAWKPASASAASWRRHEYQDSGNPWHISTSGPGPCSATGIPRPLVSTVRWVISLIVRLLLGHQGHHVLHELGIQVGAVGLTQVRDLGVQLVHGRILGSQLGERHSESQHPREALWLLAARRRRWAAVLREIAQARRTRPGLQGQLPRCLHVLASRSLRASLLRGDTATSPGAGNGSTGAMCPMSGSSWSVSAIFV